MTIKELQNQLLSYSNSDEVLIWDGEYRTIGLITGLNGEVIIHSSAPRVRSRNEEIQEWRDKYGGRSDT